MIVVYHIILHENDDNNNNSNNNNDTNTNANSYYYLSIVIDTTNHNASDNTSVENGIEIMNWQGNPTNNIFGDHSDGIQVGEGNIYGGNSDIDSPSNHSNKPKRIRLNKKHLELHHRTLSGNVKGGDNGNSGKIRANSDRQLRLQLMARRKHSTTAAVAMSPLDKSLNSQVEEKESSNHSRVGSSLVL